MRRITLIAGVALLLSAGVVYADCPAVTSADSMGMTGAFPNQFELTEFEAAGDCTLAFSENPAIADLNAKIHGNPELPAVADRLPDEPLVIAPNDQIGAYGGILDGLSNATEAGTSDILSLRHVNFMRYSADIQQVVPDVAQAWSWNDDFTVLTFELRDGHKWSDGAPFTAHDVAFWYNDIILNPAIYESTPSAWVWNGEPAAVVALDDTTVQFTVPSPAPGLINRFAISFIQPFQPQHFLGQYMDKHNEGAANLRAEHGFESEADAINFYYGGSDWKDVPSPLLKDNDKAMSLPAAVVPTLESYIVVDDGPTGRRLVANPYFHMVDTAGNQLPYINEINELYIPEKEVRNLKIVNGEVDYKMQNLFLEDFPLYKSNEESGGYSLHLTPTVGEAIYYSFNVHDSDPELAAAFSDVRFRQAMSMAIDRDELIDLVYLGQGEPMQATPAEPGTVDFLTEAHMRSFTDYDPDGARALLAEMGLTDSDGDGTVELPSGKPFVIQMFYANQGGPVKNHELVTGYWGDIGINVSTREISTDDYRTKGGAGELSIASWRDGNRAAPSISQDPFMFVPPFGDRWQPGTGYEWSKWVQSDGAEGVEPPADVMRLYELAEQFKNYEMGTPESNAVGAEVADIHLANLWKIGLVGRGIAPVVVHDNLGNFLAFPVATYDYYWAYSFRPYQWFLSE